MNQYEGPKSDIMSPMMVQAAPADGATAAAAAPRYYAIPIASQGPHRHGLFVRVVIWVLALGLLGFCGLFALAVCFTSFFLFDDPHGGNKALVMFFAMWGIGIAIALGGLVVFRCLIKIAERRVDSDSPPTYALTEMV